MLLTTMGCTLLSIVAKSIGTLELIPCQISFVEPKHRKAYLHYSEDELKNKPGGLKGRKKTRKEVGLKGRKKARKEVIQYA